jgi:hypothetical protein
MIEVITFDTCDVLQWSRSVMAGGTALGGVYSIETT